MSDTKREVKDSVFKIVFGEPILLSQFLHDYCSLDIFENIAPENIRDLSERFISPMDSNIDSDTVKEVIIPDWGELYIIAMTEHESNVNQRMPMKLLHYMSRIWEAYEQRCEKERKGATDLVGFRYPPILPLVYYDGMSKWTAPTQLLQKV